MQKLQGKSFLVDIVVQSQSRCYPLHNCCSCLQFLNSAIVNTETTRPQSEKKLICD